MFRVETVWGVIALLSVMAFSMFAGFQLRDRVNEGSPIVLRDDTKMIGEARAGGTLLLSIHRLVMHAPAPVCDGSTDRLLWRWKRTPEGIWEREIAPFAYRGRANPFPEESYMQLDLPIDAQVSAGLYWFTVVFYEPCDILVRLGFARQKIYPSIPTKVVVSAALPGQPSRMFPYIAQQDYQMPPDISMSLDQPSALLAVPPNHAPSLPDFADTWLKQLATEPAAPAHSEIHP